MLELTGPGLLFGDAILGGEVLMQIQINTDRNIEGHEGLRTHISEVVETALGRFSNQITRIEVHLRDENSDKGGSHDKRCLMEARLESRPPVAVSDRASTVGEAVHGAAEKMNRLIESSLGRVRDR